MVETHSVQAFRVGDRVEWAAAYPHLNWLRPFERFGIAGLAKLFSYIKATQIRTGRLYGRLTASMINRLRWLNPLRVTLKMLNAWLGFNFQRLAS